MKTTLKSAALVLAMAGFLSVSCKNNESTHRHDDTEVLETTTESDPPTAYKDTIVTEPDSLRELREAKAQQPAP